MSQTMHLCMFCDHALRKATDMSLHVISVHGIDFAPQGTLKKVMRPVSCWSCASPIQPYETHCECGRLKPDFRHE